jgi:hypothetical protein
MTSQLPGAVVVYTELVFGKSLLRTDSATCNSHVVLVFDFNFYTCFIHRYILVSLTNQGHVPYVLAPFVQHVRDRDDRLR